MPGGIVRYEIARTAKKIREDNGFKPIDMANFIGISEKEYIDFEECKSSLENDYYIISGIAFMCGMSVDNFFRTVRGESIVEDVIGQTAGITPEFQAELIGVIENLGYISEEEFKKLEKERGGFKFAYIDYDQVMRYVALCESDEKAGVYLVILRGEVHISRLAIYDNEKCFKIKDRMYPIRLENVKVFGKIYAGIE